MSYNYSKKQTSSCWNMERETANSLQLDESLL